MATARMNVSSCVASKSVRPSVVAHSAVKPDVGNALSSMDIKVDHVKEILRKEHEHHGQGKVMYVECSGLGRRMLAGTSVQHVQNLSESAVKSVDYSLFG